MHCPGFVIYFPVIKIVIVLLLVSMVIRFNTHQCLNGLRKEYANFSKLGQPVDTRHVL